MCLGRARTLRAEGELLILSSGICTEEAARAAAVMATRGLEAGHLHVSTLSPWEDPAIREALASARGVITVENHLVSGGLGSAVAESLAEMGLAVPLRRLGLQGTYAHGASRPYLMRRFGLDALAVVRAAEALVGRELGIDDAELDPSDGAGVERTLA
jgi:transketolase